MIRDDEVAVLNRPLEDDSCVCVVAHGNLPGPRRRKGTEEAWPRAVTLCRSGSAKTVP